MYQYITIAENVNPYHHRAHIIIHNDLWYIAEFETIEQLQFFARTLGFSYSMVESKNSIECGKFETFSIDHKIIDDGFSRMEDLPEGAKPIKALSNGSIVDCYYYNDGQTITIYRPNPNCHDIYKPLDLPEHISHRKIYGLY